MDRNDNDDMKTSQFVCAAKLYSRLLNEPISVIPRYLYMNEVEERYPATKAILGLSRKPKWKMWPHPFRPTDNCNVYRLPEADRTR